MTKKYTLNDPHVPKYLQIIEDYTSDDDYKQRMAAEELYAELSGFVGHLIKLRFHEFCRLYYYEMYNEAWLGILDQLHKYDPYITKPTSFFTYTIIHCVSKFTNKIKYKDLSNHHAYRINKIKKTISQFERDGIEPTISNIALSTGLSVKSVETELENMNYSDLVSIQAFPEDSPYFVRESENPMHKVMQNMQYESLYAEIDNLPKQDQEILNRYYGLNGFDAEMNYSKVSRMMNLSVGKVKASIQKSLRILNRAKGIRDDYNSVSVEKKADHYGGKLGYKKEKNSVSNIYDKIADPDNIED